MSGVRAGIYRYDPRHHRLLLESEGDARAAIAEAALFRDGELARVLALPEPVKPLGLLPVGRPR